MEHKYFYKIRRIHDGLYSLGGVTPKFSKSGKRWNMSGLKNHFNLINEYNKNFDNMYSRSVNQPPLNPFGYKDKYEIVQFEETIVEVGIVSKQQCEIS